ncbi:thiamine phosphate synthase [Aquimarina rhabdastrellae]
MLIVLTSEQDLTNEAQQINTLFDKGLEILHLRKPSFDIEGYRKLLKGIAPQYYNRIMIHEHHRLCNEFKLRGIHLQEQPRWDLGNGLKDYVTAYTNQDFKVSSSFHSKEEIIACDVAFEYVLLSPVFGSISKAGYEGKGFDVTDIDSTIIGMGGINASTIPEAIKLGFKGVGILGGVWNTTSSEISFMELLASYKSIN